MIHVVNCEDGAEVHDDPVTQSQVTMLTELLALAQRGALRGMVCALVYRDGTPGYATSITDHPIALVASVGMTSARYIATCADEMNDEDDDNDNEPSTS